MMPSLFGPRNDAAQLRLVLLRTLPLVLSSASLMFSWSQDISLGAFLHPSLRNDPAHPSGTILPRYLPAFMRPGLWGIDSTYPPAAVTCVINGLSHQSREARNLSFVAHCSVLLTFSGARPCSLFSPALEMSSHLESNARTR
ncbi:hypothetical protein BDW60DRAFT_187992 [Aspergillus nidulans var. acristatus]